jgi:AraC-like DNA-binding protein
MNALGEALLWCDMVNPLAEEGTIDPRIRRALEDICRNLNQPMRSSGLAKGCGLSPSRFNHLFREQVGKTARQYLELQRLHRARQLLEKSQLTISEIAYQVGFPNLFYFSLRFKRYNGVSPRGYRQKHQRS